MNPLSDSPGDTRTPGAPYLLRLVVECERFARHAGCRKIVLWTNASLLGARGIYRAAGYTLVNSEPHKSFGQALVGLRMTGQTGSWRTR